MLTNVQRRVEIALALLAIFRNKMKKKKKKSLPEFMTLAYLLWRQNEKRRYTHDD